MTGFSLAAWIGVAVAHSFTLEVAKNAKVTPQGGSPKHESIVTNSKGQAVYWLSGDSQRHPECTRVNGCFGFWPPVEVRSAHGLSKAPGASGKLGTWRRDGFLQVTLGGHPLYTFASDTHRNQAVGEGIKTFGGTWHVVKASASGSTGVGQTSSSGTTTTQPSTTGSGGCLYPPCP